MIGHVNKVMYVNRDGTENPEADLANTAEF